MKNSLLAAVAVAATLAIAGSAGAATIVNGGFAGPSPADGGFQQVNGGGVIAGWTVTSGNVDWIKGYW